MIIGGIKDGSMFLLLLLMHVGLQITIHRLLKRGLHMSIWHIQLSWKHTQPTSHDVVDAAVFVAAEAVYCSLMVVELLQFSC